MNDEKIELKLFNEDYRFVINEKNSRERLEKLARYVDGKMREIAKSYGNLSPQDIAVLTAMNIAEESLSFQEFNGSRFDNNKGDLKISANSGSKITEICNKLEKVLDE